MCIKSNKNVKEIERYKSGPLSILLTSITSNCQVIVSCRNNHKFLGSIKAFDRHCNLLLENVNEIWVEEHRKSKSKIRVSKGHEKYSPKLFLRGDSIVLIIKKNK